MNVPADVPGRTSADADPTEPLRRRIFLCHASVDKPAVRELYMRLKDDGYHPWLDEEDLLPGQQWGQEIPKAVRQSAVVLVCLSARSVTKEGYVQKEIKIALDVADEQPEGTIYLIPVRLEPCEVPDRLGRWHWVDLFQERAYEKKLQPALNETVGPPLPRAEPEEGPFQLAWGPSGYDLPQPEFLFFFPPGFLSSCALILKNHRFETARVARIELDAAIVRRVLEGSTVLGTETLTGCALRFSGGRRDQGTGLEWQNVTENRWVIDTPITLPGHGEVVLPDVELDCDEQDPSAVAEVRALFGVATLAIEFGVTVVAERGTVRKRLVAPLRVLGSLGEEGDGGILFLVKKLDVKEESERARLCSVYQRARLEDHRTRRAVAQRLNEIEQRKALDRAEQAVAISPTRAEGHYELGAVLLGAGRYEEALQSLDRALELGLEDARVPLARGQALRGLSRLEEALAEVDRVLAVHSDDANARTERGRILLDLGRHAAALAAFDSALRLAGDSAEAHHGRGLALFLMDADQEALAAFDRALARSPEMALAHVGRASALSALGRDLEAVAALREAVGLGFSDLDTLRTLEQTLGEEARSELRSLLASWGLLETWDSALTDFVVNPD